jgi:hypothetical protein
MANIKLEEVMAFLLKDVLVLAVGPGNLLKSWAHSPRQLDR